jgi:tetrahydromethanopterin S-methyltransferase subunit B
MSNYTSSRIAGIFCSMLMGIEFGVAVGAATLCAIVALTLGIKPNE